MISKRTLFLASGAAFAVFGLAAQASDGAPLSAIDWLQRALEAPMAPTEGPVGTLLPDETDARLPATHFTPIETELLEGAGLSSTGIFTAERIGLPRDLWGAATHSEVIAAIKTIPTDTVPSAARLALRLLLAEFALPRGDISGARDALFLARLDKLIELGALEQAQQLIEVASEASSAINARAFDIALLLGEEDRACAALSGLITTSYGHGAQIFCTARRGDWQAAYASLRVAQSLALVSETEALLLTRFLEEEEEEYPLPPPQETTPLGWRIMEALGDPVTTAGLPIAYAHADMRGTSGWRAQLEAAERLTRAGVMQPNRLHGLYSERRAAASGGLWDRVRLLQTLDRATTMKDSEAASAALVQAWPLFAAAELEAALAEMKAEALADLSLAPQASEILWKLALLSDDARPAAAALAPEGGLGRLVMALADGRDLPQTSSSPIAGAIVAAFNAEGFSAANEALLEAGKPGLLLLEGLALIAEAAAGDLNAATSGLQRLLAVGLEPFARQIAIELLLLERRG